MGNVYATILDFIERSLPYFADFDRVQVEGPDNYAYNRTIYYLRLATQKGETASRTYMTEFPQINTGFVRLSRLVHTNPLPLDNIFLEMAAVKRQVNPVFKAFESMRTGLGRMDKHATDIDNHQ